MPPTYINANWKFDGERFSHAVARAVDNHGVSDIAEMAGLSEDRISHWARGVYNPSNPYPNMTNFLIICNLLDLHPAIFFWVGESDRDANS